MDISSFRVDSSKANLAEATHILTVKCLSLGLLFAIVLGGYIALIPEEVGLGR